MTFETNGAKTAVAGVNGVPVQESKVRKFGRKLRRWSRHPLLILILGSLISVYLIPRIIALSDDSKALHEARIKLASEFSERNTEFNSKNNAIATLMGEFHTQVQLDPGGLKVYQNEFRRDYLARRMALDEMAWWWYGDLRRRANSLMLTTDESTQLDADFKAYGDSVLASVVSLDGLANFLRSQEFGVDPVSESKYAELWKDMWKKKGDQHYLRKDLVARIYSRLAKDK